MTLVNTTEEKTAESFSADSIIRDYRIAYQSRQASIIGRREVLTGKAKFGIFGDGKEVPQIAMARAFNPGDFRAGYYRDQTFMFALGMSSLEEFFAELYADDDISRDPSSSGRQMNSHFATRSLDADGTWKNLAERYNSSPDMSPTASQMPRLVGLAYASRLYREVEDLASATEFSNGGREIAFGTIGNASCAEGMFWEAVNAAGVLQVPMLLSIWDDGYGISVPNEYQIAKGDLSAVLAGFRRTSDQTGGIDLYTVKGWDYPALCETYLNAATIVRMEHVPAVVHVIDVTQPQGHSTSGSHERYKSKERLEWEEEFDCIRRMRSWMVAQGVATEEQLDEFEKVDRDRVRDAQRSAWNAYRAPIEDDRRAFVALCGDLEKVSAHRDRISEIRMEIERHQATLRRDLLRAATTILVATREEESAQRATLRSWHEETKRRGDESYDDHLYAEGARSIDAIEVVPASYDEQSPMINGFEILNACFDAILARDPRVSFLGEDVGKLGDVNQGCAGLQEKYGELRVTDTGIRETTIMGQAIGMAMRGLRPIAEIQYLDYILYGLQILSDDLATVRWRTRGGSMAPAIVRTRGHRLEGIWHSGSLMGGIIHLVRGMHVCVPRNMTQAAGMYNTLLAGDDPAIVVEVLNGYRVKERLPSNIAELRVPLGVPEVIRRGTDVTAVTYGATCRIVLDAAELLADAGIDIEVIDVQTLLPFDRGGVIAESIRKTGRVVFVDEDVPGGATGFMMQQVLERQGAWWMLDSEPRTISGKAHRPAYGSDGDYFSKPNRDRIAREIYGLMREADPGRFPAL